MRMTMMMMKMRGMGKIKMEMTKLLEECHLLTEINLKTI